jgi:beta-glucosidase
VAAMGLGAYRFSLEWSRIEPAEGEFSIAALGLLPPHLRRVPRAGHHPGGDLPSLHQPRRGSPRAGVGRPLTPPTCSPAMSPEPEPTSAT